jgi:HAD superfamily hydrolase (TIGR01509 family)
MAEITHTWQDAARSAHVDCRNLADESTPLTFFPGFDRYQAAEISIDEYLRDLAEFAGCSIEDALKLHNGILVTEYPGIIELVKELQAGGIHTGCLSNTNPPHWEVLALNGQYPGVHLLEMKMASHLAGINKPDPAIYRMYCDTFGLQPAAIAFFDDNRANVDSAADCGWNSRWIDSSQDTPTQLRAHLNALGVIWAKPIA